MRRTNFKSVKILTMFIPLLFLFASCDKNNEKECTFQYVDVKVDKWKKVANNEGIDSVEWSDVMKTTRTKKKPVKEEHIDAKKREAEEDRRVLNNTYSDTSHTDCDPYPGDDTLWFKCQEELDKAKEGKRVVDRLDGEHFKVKNCN